MVPPVQFFLGMSDGWFRKIVGPAATATNPLNKQISGLTTRINSLWSPDGTILWAGGQRHATPANSNTLRKSVDGGTNWTDESAGVEATGSPPGALVEIQRVWGLPESANLIYAAGSEASGPYRIWKHTGTTWPEDFDVTAAGGNRPIGLSGRTANDTWCAARHAGASFAGLLQWNGTIWQFDGVLPGSFSSTYDVAVSSSRVFVLVNEAGAYNVYSAAGFGGPWTKEVTPWSSSFIHDTEGNGTALSIDDEGGLWVWLAFSSDHRVFHRSPAGVWSTSLTTNKAGTTIGGIWAADKNNICACRDGWIFLTDDGGSTWSEYDTSSTWGFSGKANGVWGFLPDPDPPVITPIDPVDGATDVAKDKAITFSITDATSVELDQTVVYVRGEIVYNGGIVADGWTVTFTDVITERLGEVTPPALERWRATEQVEVRVTTADLNANTADRRWSFTAIRNLGVQIYPMILGGVRKQDEG